MTKDTFILTTKDFTILEAMAENPLVRDDLLVPLIRRKLAGAVVVFREDLPPGVASINSRVTFSVDGRDPDTRILSTGQMTSPIGMFLPVTTLRGLALLGLSEGQECVVTNVEGQEERLLLEAVHYQPEAARREREALRPDLELVPRKPVLRLVRGGVGETPRVAMSRVAMPVTSGGPDDPGPSAA